LLIALVSARVGSTRIYVVLPWAIGIALLFAPAASSAAAGVVVFAFAGLACSGFFPMTIGYGEATFPGMVELAAGWLIAAYQLGYGLAAFGGGALQSAVSLTTLYRGVAGLSIGMALLAVLVARQQDPAASTTADAARPHRRGRRADRSYVAARGVMPQRPVHDAPGSRATRSVPLRKASGGHVIGSMAIPCRRRSAGRVSPVNAIT
jgi:MFS family permease